jgi:hypothetical protein
MGMGTQREDAAQGPANLITALAKQQATQSPATQHRALTNNAGGCAGLQLVLPAEYFPWR